MRFVSDNLLNLNERAEPDLRQIVSAALWRYSSDLAYLHITLIILSSSPFENWNKCFGRDLWPRSYLCVCGVFNAVGWRIGGVRLGTGFARCRADAGRQRLRDRQKACFGRARQQVAAAGGLQRDRHHALAPIATSAVAACDLFRQADASASPAYPAETPRSAQARRPSCEAPIGASSPSSDRAPTGGPARGPAPGHLC